MGKTPVHPSVPPSASATTLVRVNDGEGVQIAAERRAVFRLIFIAAIMLGTLWAAAGYWCSSQLLRQWEHPPDAFSFRPQTVEEHSTKYLLAVILEDAGLLASLAGVVGLFRLPVGRWLLVAGVLAIMALKVISYIDAGNSLQNLRWGNWSGWTLQDSCLRIMMMLWPVAALAIAMAFPLVALVAISCTRWPGKQAENLHSQIAGGGNSTKDSPPIPRVLVPYRMPTTCDPRPPRSPWRPLVFGFVLISILIGLFWTVEDAAWLIYFAPHAFGSGRSARTIMSGLRILAIPVAAQTYWFSQLLSGIAALSVLAGGILTVVRIRFSRHFLVAGLCWTAVWYLMNLVNLQTQAQAYSPNELTNWVESAVGVVFFAILGCVILTRPAARF